MHGTCFIGLYVGKGWTLPPVERSEARRLANEARVDIRQHADDVRICATSDKWCLRTRRPANPVAHGEAQAE